GPSGVPEELYVHLRNTGIRVVAPVVERDVSTLDAGGRTFHLFGIDPFAEAPFRSLVTSEPAGTTAPLATLLTRPATAVLADTTAAQLGLHPGDTFWIRVGAHRHRLELAGVLTASDTLGARSIESLLVTDIATAQELTDAVGRLSHIDLLVPRGPAGGALLDRVRAALPAAAEIVPASSSARALEELSRGFSVNLRALSLLALFVGIFLIYNTMSFSVVQRRPLIGALRALGVTRGETWTMIMTEALALGALATAVGVPAGILLGGGLLRLVTRTINDLYVVVAVSELSIRPETLLTGAALGVGGTLVAALAPALEATRSTPRAALGRSTLETRTRALVPWSAWSGVALLAAGARVLALPGRSLAVSYAGLFTILLGAALLTPGATVAVVWAAQPLAGAAFGVLGRMATRGVVAALSRTAVVMAALMIAVAASVGVGIMIESFRQSVVRWLESALQADVYVAAPSLVSSRTDATLDPELVARVRAAPGVAAVGTQRTVRVHTPSGTIRLIVLAVAPRGYRAFTLKEGSAATLTSTFADGGGVLVSEPFAYHRRLRVGDHVRLRTDAGEHDFPIAGIVYDYGSSEGVVMMGRATFDRFWNDRGLSALAVYAADPRAVDALVDTLRRVAGPEHDVLIRSNRALREASLEVFDRTFAVTTVLRVLAMVVAFVGVLSALMAQELERAREIGVLRALGLTPGQVWKLATAQTGFMGLVAGLL
ncbi:MAG TPA: ABC transporter permease, partial [Solirubrobacteraceae bacterium]